MRSLRKKLLTKASSKDSKGGEELLSKENSTYKAWFFSLKNKDSFCSYFSTDFVMKGG
jgi:hypothetical protein